MECTYPPQSHGLQLGSSLALFTLVSLGSNTFPEPTAYVRPGVSVLPPTQRDLWMVGLGPMQLRLGGQG
jgi:hypothetical protein